MRPEVSNRARAEPMPGGPQRFATAVWRRRSRSIAARAAFLRARCIPLGWARWPQGQSAGPRGAEARGCRSPPKAARERGARSGLESPSALRRESARLLPHFQGKVRGQELIDQSRRRRGKGERASESLEHGDARCRRMTAPDSCVGGAPIRGESILDLRRERPPPPTPEERRERPLLDRGGELLELGSIFGCLRGNVRRRCDGRPNLGRTSAFRQRRVRTPCDRTDRR